MVVKNQDVQSNLSQRQMTSERILYASKLIDLREELSPQISTNFPLQKYGRIK